MGLTVSNYGSNEQQLKTEYEQSLQLVVVREYRSG